MTLWLRQLSYAVHLRRCFESRSDLTCAFVRICLEEAAYNNQFCEHVVYALRLFCSHVNSTISGANLFRNRHLSAFLGTDFYICWRRISSHQLFSIGSICWRVLFNGFRTGGELFHQPGFSESVTNRPILSDKRWTNELVGDRSYQPAENQPRTFVQDLYAGPSLNPMHSMQRSN